MFVEWLTFLSKIRLNVKNFNSKENLLKFLVDFLKFNIIFILTDAKLKEKKFTAIKKSITLKV